MPAILTLEQRFWSKVIKKDGCWGWNGCKDTNGYGHLGPAASTPKTVRAHVVSWRIHYGEIPEGMHICHKCDNPECSNPEHLFMGTPKQNMLDKIGKGRSNLTTKLSKRQMVEIICLDGIVSRKCISRVFGVAESTVCRVIKGCQRKDHKRYAAHVVTPDT